MKNNFLLLILFVGLFLSGTYLFAQARKSTEVKYDFGDAPDTGYFTYYGSNGTNLGSFPSKLASFGARAVETNDVWLGNDANKESDAKLINGDSYDDGVDADLKSCKTSKAKVLVSVKNPGETAGTAYLNIYFDWNKDGVWSGADECADEWAVRNFPIDLSAQDNAIEVYIPEFTAGSNVKNIWYRAIITKNERLTYLNQNGQGEFASGEVEDYGPILPANGKTFGAVCRPDLLIIKHGKEGTFNIKKKPNSIALSDAYLANSVTPKTAARKIWDTGLSFVYESKQIDPPKRVVWETVPVKVKFIAKTATKIVNCQAAVVHGSLAATPQDIGDYTKPEITGSITEEAQDGKTVISGTITPACEDLIAAGVYGIEIPLQKQYPEVSIIETEMVSLNLNGCTPVQCATTSEKISCLGTEPMQYNVSSFFDVFTDIETVPKSLHVNLLDAGGNIMAAADLPLL